MNEEPEPQCDNCGKPADIRGIYTEPQCKCDLRTKLVGDGCAVCNPELAAELIPQCIDGVHDFRDVRTFADGTAGSRCTKCKHEVVD